MSAYIEDKAHIDALVTLAIRGPAGSACDVDSTWRKPRWFNSEGEIVSVEFTAGPRDLSADTLGRLLWSENLRSIQHRYPDTLETGDYPGPCDFNEASIAAYVWRRAPLDRRLTAVEGLVALEGYEYQSCESPDWRESDAYRFCDALRRMLIRFLPGWNEAQTWEIRDRVTA